MTPEDVLSVLALLRRAGTDAWIGGGWGIDALVGEQTRDHRDLDLMHRLEQERDVVAALAAAGFAETLDRRPVRSVVTDAAGREIDLHPLVFAADGSATQASLGPDRPFPCPASCFVTGTIGTSTVPCLSADRQVHFHQGYEPTGRDLHDMGSCARGSASPPASTLETGSASGRRHGEAGARTSPRSGTSAVPSPLMGPGIAGAPRRALRSPGRVPAPVPTAWPADQDWRECRGSWATSSGHFSCGRRVCRSRRQSTVARASDAPIPARAAISATVSAAR